MSEIQNQVKIFILFVPVDGKMDVVVIMEVYKYSIFSLFRTMVHLKVCTLLEVILDQLLGLHSKL